MRVDQVRLNFADKPPGGAHTRKQPPWIARGKIQIHEVEIGAGFPPILDHAPGSARERRMDLYAEPNQLSGLPRGPVRSVRGFYDL
jgi:hypothetical protein